MTHIHVQIIFQAALGVAGLAVIARRPVPVLPQHMCPNLQGIGLTLHGAHVEAVQCKRPHMTLASMASKIFL